MNIVFMGTPEFAATALEKIVEQHNVVAVITQPDRPKNRGKKMLPPPVKILAEEKGIPVYQPEKIKDKEFTQFLKTIDADIYVVAAFGQILSQEILDIPKFGSINIHGSILPAYRGAAPIQWAIINGEEKTGVTIMYMEKALDSGDMIIKEETQIKENETYGELYERLSYIGADLVLKALRLIENNEVKAEKQDHSISTYAPMIDKQLGHIDFSKNSREIINLIRGLNPSPSAYAFLNEETIKIFEAEEIPLNEGETGQIVSLHKRGFVVKTGNSGLLITQIQAKGGKRMSSADYMRGHKIEVGSFLK